MSFAISTKGSSDRDRARVAAPRVAAARAPASRSSGAPSCACGGGCPRCRARAEAPASRADDPLERQADRVAEQVTGGRGAAAAAPIDPLPAPRVQAKDAGGAGDAGRVAHSVASPRGGRPLPESTRAFMEARLGADFGGVRVHEGGEAQRLSADLDARAFTYGPHVWLGANESAHDGKLMAHELTHVLQQRAGGAYIARQPKDDKKDSKQSGAGTGTAGAGNAGASSVASFPGCDKKTTGVDDAPDTLLGARALALGAVQNARAAFKPLKSSTIVLLDRHFHCPSNTQLQTVMKTLAAIEAALPTLSVRCLDAKDADCAAGGRGQAVDSKPELHACPPYFDQDVSDVFRAVTFIFAAAAGIGRHQRCRREEACYDDFMQTASTALENPYAYAWFAVEVSGLSTPDSNIVPCRPLETGTYVVVSPAARKDPTQIRRLSGYDTHPQGSEIITVWIDTGGKHFIYHDDIAGAKTFLPGEKKRFYFPEDKTP